MTTNAYDVGDVARISVALTDAAGDPVAPSALSLLVESPDGEVAEFEIGDLVNTGVGAYYKDIPVALAGYYQYRWVATGSAPAADQGRFWARAVNVEAPV